MNGGGKYGPVYGKRSGKLSTAGGSISRSLLIPYKPNAELPVFSAIFDKSEDRCVRFV